MFTVADSSFSSKEKVSGRISSLRLSYKATSKLQRNSKLSLENAFSPKNLFTLAKLLDLGPQTPCPKDFPSKGNNLQLSMAPTLLCYPLELAHCL